MVGALFVGAILLTAIVLVLRRRRRHNVWDRWRELEGHSPQRAVPVGRFDEIDAWMRRDRCVCGGYMNVISEGSASGSNGSVRVVHAECTRCEEEMDVFFDLREVQH